MGDLDITLDDQGALRLRFNRPAHLNALTGEMADQLAATVEQATHDATVRVVVLTGAGGAFSSGADLSGTEAHEHLNVTALDRANRMIRAITGLDRPVLAAVDGIAAGVGCSVALACDVVVASESAAFLLATATVAASVGRARAMRMALLAEPLTAQEAYDAGLVTHLAAADVFEDQVATLVRRLAAGPPLALAAAKRAINAATLAQLEPALECERRGQSLLLRTDDVAEGMRAFGEKRRPRFTGR